MPIIKESVATASSLRYEGEAQRKGRHKDALIRALRNLQHRCAAALVWHLSLLAFEPQRLLKFRSSLVACGIAATLKEVPSIPTCTVNFHQPGRSPTSDELVSASTFDPSSAGDGFVAATDRASSSGRLNLISLLANPTRVGPDWADSLL